jgi:hypothetical protein
LKKLLIKLIDYIVDPLNPFTGMCLAITMMDAEGLINPKEYEMLRVFIRLKSEEEDRPVGEYWWVTGVKKPRLQWLNEKIAELGD